MHRYEHKEKCETCWQKFITTQMFYIQGKLCCFKCSMDKLKERDLNAKNNRKRG